MQRYYENLKRVVGMIGWSEDQHRNPTKSVQAEYDQFSFSNVLSSSR